MLLVTNVTLDAPPHAALGQAAWQTPPVWNVLVHAGLRQAFGR
jgi:hypothetical protein